jgi:Protein of unknown function (DUF1501)
LNRRHALQIGALSWLGLDAGLLAAMRKGAGETKHRRNSCVFLFLFGGPSHIDLWDMKPQAPREIRGEFRPAATNVPGIHLCEHLPLLAKQMDKLCLLRSMTHHMPVHGPACSEVYTGREYFGPPVTDQATPRDWPSLAAMVTRFGKSQPGLPNAVVLPWFTQFVGQDRRIAGQTGGRMGEEFNPFLVEGNPKRDDFHVPGLMLPAGLSADRFHRRRELLRELDGPDASRRPLAPPLARYTGLVRKAERMVQDARIGRALQLGGEPATLRDRYGRTRIGQSLLLARRMVEAGVPLITVNWDDDHKSDKVSPHWDTHVENFPKLKDRLCPPFDRAVSAFVADLHERGLLETTLVVALGEFGRTPKVGSITQNNMTKPTGRDHWPHAFTVLLAGGGVRGGQVYGETVANGGYVKDKPVSPADLAATVLHHLGVDSRLRYDDRFLQTRQRLCVGKPIRELG